MDETDVVLAVNHGSSTVVWEYNNRKYRLKPARSAQDGLAIPWLAAELYLGDASLRNVTDGDQHRTKRVQRLAVKLGLMDKPWYTDDPNMTTAEPTDQNGVTVYAYTASVPEPGEDGHGYSPAEAIAKEYRYRHPNLPFITLHVIADPDNQRIPTLVDDPWGEASTLDLEYATAETDAARDQISHLTRQVEFLMGRLAQNDPEAAADLLRGQAGPKVNLAARFASPDIDGDQGASPLADPGQVNVLSSDVANAFAAANQAQDHHGDRSIDDELAAGDGPAIGSEVLDDADDDDDTPIPPSPSAAAAKKAAKKVAPRQGSDR